MDSQRCPIRCLQAQLYGDMFDPSSGLSSQGNAHTMARTTCSGRFISVTMLSPPEKQVTQRNRQGNHSQDDEVERVEDLPFARTSF